MLGATILLCAACSGEVTELARVVSPGGETTALLQRIDAGGAAGSRAYEVYLVPGSKTADDGRRVFSGSHCDKITLAWRDEHTLSIKYTPGCSIYEFRNTWYGPRALENEAVPATPTEVILVRQPPLL